MLGFYLSLLDTEEEKSNFEQLYLTYRQDMYKTAYSILKNKFDAEDAVHEAFIRIIGKLTNISEINCPQTRSYLIIIVKNAALKMLKEKRRLVYIDEGSAISNDVPDLVEEIISNMEIEEIMRILRELSDDYYEILFLSLVMGSNISELSELLGITYENAKKRLQRAKKKFREIAERRHQ